ncbi:hypothetical protein IEO21_05978 [Rhodonia placenta]|uniref:Uncharacterized protein n=1 Tax=Rhodonia placenta TaxID=104341 RepID=A0A8H7P152_9APHY|nr:hypothetical protein IEO21_05978 [Postia placenta]
MIRLGLIAVFASAGAALAQTWCGKNYMEGSPIVPPGGQFPIPATSFSPLLAFRCAPVIKPYLPEDAFTSAAILIDTPIVYSEIAGTAPVGIPEEGPLGVLSVIIESEGKRLSTGIVPLNVTKYELSFSLLELAPKKGIYDVTCSATYAAHNGLETFTASTELAYVPSPTDGSSVVKMDARTGALLAKPATGNGGDYETVLPVGFFTGFTNYIAANLSLINEAQEKGYTTALAERGTDMTDQIHPIPTFGNLTQLQEVIARIEEVGMYLMYDMRWAYMNDTELTAQVNLVKNSPALLLWYTGDEPDGSSDPLDAAAHAYDLIYELDGYHPVSLCLNCYDYYWSNYTAGADIVMQDTYMISNNATFSSEWHTPCMPDFGDCGCDDCKGVFEDISERMDHFAYRLWVNGWDRSKTVWAVPQAFGDEDSAWDARYWTGWPTGPEFVLQSALAINHGGTGVIAWAAPTTDDIWEYASSLAQSSATLKEYILNDAAVFQHVFSNQIDIGLWTVGEKTLVLATNLNYANEMFDLATVPGLKTAPVVEVLHSGATLEGSVITFTSVGTGSFIFG